MVVSIKPSGILYFAAASCTLVAIFVGLEWRQSRNEREPAFASNRQLMVELSELREALAASRQAADDYTDSADKVIQDLEQRLARLVAINARLAESLQGQTNRVVIADGQIRSVAPDGKKVWINLGDADGLTPRTTFDIYSKKPFKVDGDDAQADVEVGTAKGTIEVTRILEPHLAEAQILNEKLEHPIVRGDSIYSLSWSPGGGDAISILGLIDLDGDGRDDHKLFQELLKTAGFVIDNEVDELGNLRVNGNALADGKPRITEKTKFVVIGKTLQIGVTDDVAKMARSKRLNERRKELEDSARERGVRIVSLSNFLRFLGFEAHAGVVPAGGNSPE